MIPFSFLLPLFSNWQRYAVYTLIAVVIGITGYIKGCSDERVKFVAFKAKVKAIGKEAEKEAKKQEARDKAKKERVDEAHKRDIARLERDNKRLRDSAGKSVLPPAAPGSASPERAAFNRAELERALRGFTKGTAELVIEGDRAIADLNAAREWAK